LTGLVLVGSLSGMLVGVRVGAWLSPTTMGRITATVTVMVATILIVVNVAKLAGFQIPR
jgi:hypothetical protein